MKVWIRSIGSCLAVTVFMYVSTAQAVPIEVFQFASDATTIDFEGPTTELPSIDGVTFPQEGPVNGPGWYASTIVDDGTFFGDKIFSNLTNIGYSDLAIEFATPVKGVGGWIGQIDNFRNANPPIITFSVFGITGLLEETDVSLPELGFDSPLFVGFASDLGITRVEWRNHNTGFFGVDNVIYGTIAVPEPGTFALVLAGVFGMVRRFHRRC